MPGTSISGSVADLFATLDLDVAPLGERLAIAKGMITEAGADMSLSLGNLQAKLNAQITALSSGAEATTAYAAAMQSLGITATSTAQERISALTYLIAKEEEAIALEAEKDAAYARSMALALERDALNKQIIDNDILRANMEAEGTARAEAIMLANKKAANAETLALFKEEDAAHKAMVDAKILRNDQEAMGAVQAAAIEAESNSLGGLRATVGRGGPRLYGSGLSSGMIAAGAAAFGAYEIANITKQAADAARETQNLADRLDLTWQEARNLQVEAELAGVKLGGLEQSAYHLAQALEEPAGAGKRVAEELAKLGITGSTAGELLKNTLTYLSQIGDKTERIAALHDIFQRSSQQIEPLVEKMAEMNDIVTRLGPNISESLKGKLDDAAKSFTLLGVAWDRFKERIASGPFGQAAATAAEGGANLLEQGFFGLPSQAAFDRALGTIKGYSVSSTFSPLTSAGSVAEDWARSHSKALEDYRADLALTETEVKRLASILGSTVNPIPDDVAGMQKRVELQRQYDDEKYNELTIRNHIKDLENQSKEQETADKAAQKQNEKDLKDQEKYQKQLEDDNAAMLKLMAKDDQEYRDYKYQLEQDEIKSLEKQQTAVDRIRLAISNKNAEEYRAEQALIIALSDDKLKAANVDESSESNHITRLLEMRRKWYDQLAQAGKLSADELLALDLDLDKKELDVQQAALDKEKANLEARQGNYTDYLSRVAELNKKQLALDDARLAKDMQSQEIKKKESALFIELTKQTDQEIRTISAGLATLAVDGGKFGDVMGQATKQLAKTIFEDLIQFAFGHLLMAIFNVDTAFYNLGQRMVSVFSTAKNGGLIGLPPGNPLGAAGGLPNTSLATPPFMQENTGAIKDSTEKIAKDTAATIKDTTATVGATGVEKIGADRTAANTDSTGQNTSENERNTKAVIDNTLALKQLTVVMGNLILAVAADTAADVAEGVADSVNRQGGMINQLLGGGGGGGGVGAGVGFIIGGGGFGGPPGGYDPWGGYSGWGGYDPWGGMYSGSDPSSSVGAGGGDTIFDFGGSHFHGDTTEQQMMKLVDKLRLNRVKV